MFANSSPGLRSGTWDDECNFSEDGTPEGVASPLARPSQLLQSCDEPLNAFLFPGFQSKPWAEISQHLRCKGNNSKMKIKVGIYDYQQVGLVFNESSSTVIVETGEFKINEFRHSFVTT